MIYMVTNGKTLTTSLEPLDMYQTHVIAMFQKLICKVIVFYELSYLDLMANLKGNFDNDVSKYYTTLQRMRPREETQRRWRLKVRKSIGLQRVS